MDDSTEENWVIVNSVDIAQEAKECLEEQKEDDETDTETDGISVISESSPDEVNEDESNLIGTTGTRYKNDDSNDFQEHTFRNIGTNWTFLDSSVDLSGSTSGKPFYLDCLQEPIQEISEQELGNAHSDTDSFSIISKPESLVEDLGEKEGIGLLEIDIYEPNLKIPNCLRKYFSGFLIGTIFIAISSMVLGYYFSYFENIEDNLPLYKRDSKDIKDNYDVPTALMYCRQQYKADDIFIEQNIQKCLNTIENRDRRKRKNIIKNDEMEKLKRYLKIKEHYLDEKEKFLIKKEYEVLRTEMKSNCNYFHENKKRKKEKDKKRGGDEKKIDIGIKQDEPNVINKKEKKLKKDDKKCGKKCNETNKKPKDTISKNFPTVERNNSQIYIKNKNHPKGDKNKFTESEKHNVNESLNFIILDNIKENKTVSGYWIDKMFKARNELRNREHHSNWYFDRAQYRKRKRDKAKWYFDWMNGRDFLRYKRTFYI